MYALTLEATLQGVTNLSPNDTPEAPYHYHFEVQCTSCRETHDKLVSFTRFEMKKVSGSKGEANFVWRCGFCKRESTASFKGPPKTYINTNTTPSEVQKIIEFDCRGLEFTDFRAVVDKRNAKGQEQASKWSAKGLDSKSEWKDIDLDQEGWFEYDSEAREEVSITDVKWGFIRT